MTILKIKNIQKSFGDKQIIKNAEFTVLEGSRIGIVGNNGSGKTTLVNILNGNITPDQGIIEFVKGSLRIGYLMQTTETHIDEVSSIFQSEQEVQKHLKNMKVIKNKRWNETAKTELSEGEKLKLSLAKIWSNNPEFIILDEPTNHLDMNGVEWLIQEINNFKGAVMIISHDRFFLDQIVNEIIELDDGCTKKYSGNFTFYQKEKKRLFDSLCHQYENQQKEKVKIQKQISTLKNWSEKAHRDSTKQGSNSERKQIGLKEYNRVKAKRMDVQIRSKMTRLTNELKKNEIQSPRKEKKIEFSMEMSKKRGKRIIEVEALEKNYGKRCIFSDTHFYINHGERFGLIGVNGSGKSTLLKILLGMEPYEQGSVWRSESLKIGYLSQDVADLPLQQSALEFTALFESEAVARARTLFANIGLPEEKILCPMSALSLGERTRVKLISLMMKNVDFLILDEPTNHLDLASREGLERVIDSFKGTLLVVSHDLYFMNHVCEKLLVIENETIKRLDTGLKDFREWENNASTDKEIEESLLLIQNKISVLIGKIAMISNESEEYAELDREINKLLKQKVELNKGNFN